MVDSHAHLSSPQLESSADTIIAHFFEQNGHGLLNVGYDHDTSHGVVQLTKKYQHIDGINLHGAVGLHPGLFYKESHFDSPITSLTGGTSAFALIESLVERHLQLISGIGETGLDYYHIKQNEMIPFSEQNEIKQLQKHMFRLHMELAMKHNLPLTIHIRDIDGSSECVEDALALLTEVGRGEARGVFHSYTGPAQYTSNITDLGFLIGFNGILTYNSADNVRKILTALDWEHIITETDAPFLRPVGKSKNSIGNYSQPSDVFTVVEKIAQLRNTTIHEVNTHMCKNFDSLFGQS